MSDKRNLIQRILGLNKPKSATPTSGHLYGEWWPVKSRRWDGEKTLGELGNVIINIPDFKRLRYRSYDAADKIDIIKTITGKFFKYIIGSGLKLQSEPNVSVLKLEGINQDLTDFKKTIEARFNVYANSKNCSQNKMLDLHDLANDSFSTAFLGGDVLVVARVDKNARLSLQVIDGEHIESPVFDQSMMDAVKKRKNFLKHGVEYDANGEHVGFFIKVQDPDQPFGKMQYIPAKGKKSNRVFAWMVYGSKQRPDQVRGIPVIASILEKVNKLDRYTEAAVGKAEEAANLMMAIKHNVDSTGENPFAKAISKKINANGDEEQKTSYDLADGLANKINQTTSKTAVNLPVGAELVSFSTDIESKFGEFYTAIFNSLCASVDLPPEVALQQYNSNYSASRAAIGAWQHIVEIERTKFSKNFYKRFYNLWLELEILNNKVEAPGFITALNTNDLMVIEAYSACRFIGKKMPHIDPLKEVKAARAILGDEVTPLSSYENVVEDLNLGDFNANYEKYLEERSKLKPLPKEEPPKEPKKQ